MKRQILIGLAGLSMVSVALGVTDPIYINNNILIFDSLNPPPQIDASNFVNNAAFINNSFNSLFVIPYETANTVNYTNSGVLSALEGFRFDTYNPQTALYSRAGTLLNGTGAIINCGGTNAGPFFTTNAIFFGIFGQGSECLAWATNIINRGTIEMGQDSLLSLEAQNISLSGGLVTMEGFESGNVFGNPGMFDGYWGLGSTPDFNPAGNFGSLSASSPLHWVTNRYYADLRTALSVSPPGKAYLHAITNANDASGFDVIWQVVYLQNTSSSVSNNVYFGFGAPVVEWLWPSTNIITGLAQTNHLYLEDDMIGITNLVLTTNGIAPPSTGYRPTYIPTNYFLFQFQSPLFSFGTPATNTLLPNIFTPNDRNISTEYTAYEAIFEPITVILGEVAGQTFTNMPGRIEIEAEKQLDLSFSRISGLNYLRLTATNNFTQNANTRILTAVADYNLGVTNATLTVSNLLAPTCPRLNGLVNVFSTRWTNVAGPFTNITSTATNVFNNTNTYFVTMVTSQLESSFPSLVNNLTLHATNVVISDVLNVLSNITIDAYNLTITTNGRGAQIPAGQLNFPLGDPLGAGALPRLRTLTNYGIISVQNSATFGTAAQPYWDFVNRGSLLVQGCSIWATNFENIGLLDSGPGQISLTATSAGITNGIFNAPFNDINFNVGSLFISNQVLTVGHSLTIWATNSLSDGGPSSGNMWTAGFLGFNLPFLPPVASLLGTTITGTAPAFASVVNQWAGRDLGPVAAGFSNNAALGRLILDGGTPGSTFVFSAPTGNNALYVDYLELKNNLANFDSSGNLANLQFDPGMKIYYAQLIINGISWAEKLNNKNGGGLNWVPSYAGAFSSTNVVYPDGTTNLLNTALVQSCDLDSNRNGIPNCLDPAPVLVPSVIGLAAALTNTPQNAVVLSWNSIPFSTNSVFFKPSLAATNWQLLTNFVLGSTAGQQRIVDPVVAGGRLYRVRVDAASP